MDHILYLVIVCLTYALLERLSAIYMSNDYWFLAGWIAGIVVSMLYKYFAIRVEVK